MRTTWANWYCCGALWGRGSSLRAGQGFLLEVFVRTAEIFEALVGNAPDSGGRFFEQVVIVGDEEERSFEFLQREVEGVDGFEVEVVGGLVEDQDVGLLQHHATEEEARGFPAR